MTASISIVLGSYQRKKFLKQTIYSVRKELSLLECESEIIVIDGGSTDGSLRWLCKQKDIITIVQHNNREWNNKKVEKKSWGYFMNLGFKIAKGEYICMISDDCLFVPGAIKNGLELIEKRLSQNEKIGGAAFYWRDVPGPPTYWVGLIKEDKILINHGIFAKKALEDVNYINENDFKFYYADADLCLRIFQKGYRIIVSQDSYIEHYSHAAFNIRKKNSLNAGNDKIAFEKKWNNVILEKNPEFSSFVQRREFIDPNNTYKIFRKAQLINLQHLKNKLKNTIKKIIKTD
ncbi:MAG: glycosyltransferase [Bacteroidales bacterium]|nr:glycosyltransferase [Bacteroidales bacterium]